MSDGVEPVAGGGDVSGMEVIELTMSDEDRAIARWATALGSRSLNLVARLVRVPKRVSHVARAPRLRTGAERDPAGARAPPPAPPPSPASRYAARRGEVFHVDVSSSTTTERSLMLASRPPLGELHLDRASPGRLRGASSLSSPRVDEVEEKIRRGLTAARVPDLIP